MPQDINELLISQAVRGVQIFADKISATTAFRVYHNTLRHAIEVYGVESGAPVLFNGEELRRYVANSRVQMNQRTGAILEGSRDRNLFSEITTEYRVPQELCLAAFSKLVIREACVVRQLDDSLFEQRLHSELHIQISGGSKVYACPRVKYLTLTLREHALFDGRRTVPYRRPNGSPGGNRQVSLALDTLKMRMRGNCVLKGVAIRQLLDINLQDTTSRFKVGVIAGCLTQYAVRGRETPVSELPPHSSIRNLEPPLPPPPPTLAAAAESALQSSADAGSSAFLASLISVHASAISNTSLGNGSIWAESPVRQLSAVYHLHNRLAQHHQQTLHDEEQQRVAEAVRRSEREYMPRQHSDDHAHTYRTERARPAARHFTVIGQVGAAARIATGASSACVVCMENERAVILMPCGHATFCPDCMHAAEKSIKRCPECRTPISSAVIPYNYACAASAPPQSKQDAAPATSSKQAAAAAAAAAVATVVRDEVTAAASTKEVGHVEASPASLTKITAAANATARRSAVLKRKRKRPPAPARPRVYRRRR